MFVIKFVNVLKGKHPQSRYVVGLTGRNAEIRVGHSTST